MKSRPATKSRTFRTCWRVSSRASMRTSTRRTFNRTTISVSRSRKWACSTRRLQSCRKRCVHRKASCALRKCWVSASSRRARTASPNRSCAAGSICPPTAIRSDSASCTGLVAHSNNRARRRTPAICTGASSRSTFVSSMPSSASKRSPRRSSVSQQVARVSLRDVQRPVAGELEQVVLELRRLIAADFPIVSEVNDHLLQMKGKLFRPTLLLLSHQAAGSKDPRAVTLAAVVELIHLATLVHDDSVDHSVLRRGLPTINALFSHQIAVIMGDYLYSRAIIELVRLDDHEALRVLARVTNEMTVGEMRQLEAHDKLAYGEEAYDQLIRAKTASLLSGACEVGALQGPTAYREALARFGMRLGMAFQIADDLLDYTEAEAVTGKPSGLDLREHKVTLPLIAALGDMPPADRRLVAELMAAPEPTDALVAGVVRCVAAAGGLDYARRRALELAQQADGELDILPMSPARDALRDSIAYAVERRS